MSISPDVLPVQGDEDCARSARHLGLVVLQPREEQVPEILVRLLICPLHIHLADVFHDVRKDLSTQALVRGVEELEVQWKRTDARELVAIPQQDQRVDQGLPHGGVHHFVVLIENTDDQTGKGVVLAREARGDVREEHDLLAEIAVGLLRLQLEDLHHAREVLPLLVELHLVCLRVLLHEALKLRQGHDLVLYLCTIACHRHRHGGPTRKPRADRFCGMGRADKNT
mmetsp:Transcript_143594/g.459318  ORF Transcript_143594/g.459318 Transcript_143594/m.459318 type:complete len:226 (-) Transcript_143594:22-699(-)